MVGTGAFATVRKVVNKSTGQVRALKIIKKQLSYTLSSKLAEINITLNVCVNIKGNEQIYKVDFPLPEQSKINEVISNGIQFFNGKKFIFKDNHGNPQFRLQFSKKDIDTYRLKACKKNGKPKEDYPPYYGDSVLGDTGTKTFSLIYIDKQLITKPIINRKTGPACPECSIF